MADLCLSLGMCLLWDDDVPAAVHRMTEEQIQALADKLTQNQFRVALMLAHDAVDAGWRPEVLAERIGELMATEFRRGIQTAITFHGLGEFGEKA